MTSAYPKRPRFFACRFIRELAKHCVANELGPQAFTLLTVIATTEDARGYTDAVTFFNEQLLPQVGLGSVDSLDRVRAKCIKAGWLHYIPGGRRLGPGRYWVTIPDRHSEIAGAPADEAIETAVLLRIDAEQSTVQSTVQSAEQSAEQGAVQTPVPNSVPQPCGAKHGANREQTAEPSSLCLYPNTSPAVAGEVKVAKPEKARKKPGEDDPLFCQFYAAYPLREDRPAAWKAWQRLKPGPELAALILQGVERYKRSKPDWQHWKQPGPWLNARRWEDSVSAECGAGNEPVVKRAADVAMLSPERLQQNFEPMEGSYDRTG